MKPLWLRLLRVTAPIYLSLVLTGCGPDIFYPLVHAQGDPTFTLAVSPIIATLLQGATPAPFNAVITPLHDFDSAVVVSVPSLPNGILCQETPCTTTIAAGATTGVLHLAPSSAAAPGTYTLTFTAVSGSITQTATATIVVPTPVLTPDFTLAVTPTTSSTPAGTAAPADSFTITPLNGFAAPVTIAAGAPAGITCSLSPCSVTTSLAQINNALQFTPAATLTPGIYTLTFTATSGNLTHTITTTLTVTAPTALPDFAFAVAPTASSTTAGTPASADSFTVTPLNGFASSVTITGSAPAGITCSLSPCTVTTSLTQLNNALQFTPTTTLTPGTYILTFTATSGSLSHTATATLIVTAPGTTPPASDLACSLPATPSSPTPGPTSFIYLGDDDPPASLYDAAHNHIFVSNHQLGEVDVIDPNSATIIARIPVSGPEGLDLTADGTLLVGTLTQSFYRINTATLCIIDRPSLSGLGSTEGAWLPISLADGTIMFVLIDDFDTGSGLALWSPTGTTMLHPGNELFSFYSATRSGDRQHVVLIADDTSPAAARYDVSTGQFVYPPANMPLGQPIFNQDGSRMYAISGTGNGVIVALDPSFNVLATYTGLQLGGVDSMILSPDASKLYVEEGYFPVIAVIDTSSMNALGFVSAQNIDGSQALNILGNGRPFGGGNPYNWDGAGRILASAAPFVRGNGGMMLFKPDTTLLPDFNSATIHWAPLSPDDIESGPTTILQYSNEIVGETGNSNTTPISGTFSEGLTTKTVPATVGQYATGTLYAQYNAPPFSSGCADFLGTFNIGTGAAIPRAFCYAPVVSTIDGDTGPSTGGNTLTLYGKGFGAHPTVTIGGKAATITGTALYGYFLDGFDPEYISLTVPPGTPGLAPIIITKSSGQSLTLPNAYTYVETTSAPFPSGAVPVQLIYDPIHDHLLWTDSGRNKLVVSSSTTGQSTQEIALPSTPGGLSLAPDGAHLFITFPSTGTLTEYDAVTFASQASTTFSVSTDPFSPSGPVYAAALKNGKAVAVTSVGFVNGIGNVIGYLWDPTVNQTQPLVDEDAFGCTQSPATAVVSADGSLAVINSVLYNTSTGAFTFIQSDYCSTAGISRDGSFIATAEGFSNASGFYTGFYSPPARLAADFNSFASFSDYTPQIAVNPTGSIAARLTTDALWLFEPATGALLQKLNFAGPNLASQPSSPLALDPAGLRYWILTPTGISGFTFEHDPLALGEVQYTAGSLQILGSGFTSQTEVAVDGTPLTANFVDAQHLQLAPPALSSGAHSVRVTNPDGHTSLLPLAFDIP